MTDRAEILANSAIAQIRALQREIQGLKNQLVKLTQRIDALETALPGEHKPAAEFPRHVPGTTGRGIQYELSDGTRINAGKVKALAAEARLKESQFPKPLAMTGSIPKWELSSGETFHGSHEHAEEAEARLHGA